MFGVGTSLPPWQPMSESPRSAARLTITFGLRSAAASGAAAAADTATAHTSRFIAVPPASVLAHELLHPLADDVAGVDVPLRIDRDGVHPVQLARLLLLVLALGHRP